MIVRIFGFRGVEQLPVNLPKFYSADSIYQLVYPYEWRDHLTSNGATPQTSTAPIDSTTSKTNVLRVEVPDGQAIRYEINPPGRQGGIVPADQYSPILSGINNFYFRGGFSFSMVDASGT